MEDLIMSLGQQSPQTPASPAYGDPSFAAPPPQQGTNGLSIAGFVLAIVVAPIGFILSIVGLVQAGRRGQKGKGLAIAGIIISLVLMVTGVAAAVAVGMTVGKKVATLADPGCTVGKAAILDNASKISSPDTAKAGLQASIDGLNSAIAKAQHDDVRNAMKAVADDYSQLLQAINTGTAPDPGLQDKLTADAEKVDSLCTVGPGK
jgi:hypothetical protein